MWGHQCGHGYQRNYPITIELLARACSRLTWNFIHKIAWRCKDGRVIAFLSSLLEIWLFRTKKEYYFLYFSLIALYSSFITFLWQAFCNRWPLFAVSKMNKRSCLLCENFISVYNNKQNITWLLGIRISSSHAESISHEWAQRARERYFKHSKIRFVSPRGHVYPLYNWIGVHEITKQKQQQKKEVNLLRIQKKGHKTSTKRHEWNGMTQNGLFDIFRNGHA